MHDPPIAAIDDERRVIDRIAGWAQTHRLVRAVLLTGSRANPRASVDWLSDFDLDVVVTDTRPFVIDESWLSWYGQPMVMFRDNGADNGADSGAVTAGRLVLYDDGTRIDFGVYPVHHLTGVVAAGALPRDLDLGYRVLVDKDGLTEGLRAPTHTANIPPPPGEAEFREVVEEFWWDTTYVAKFLWRDELFFAHASLRSARDHLLRVLEWGVEIEHGWSLPLWVRGRQLKRRLGTSRWAEVELTFAGPALADNWRALFALTRLFGSTAAGVATRLGFDYPRDLDRAVTTYLSRIQSHEPDRSKEDRRHGHG